MLSKESLANQRGHLYDLQLCTPLMLREPLLHQGLLMRVVIIQVISMIQRRQGTP